jgi:hypothetical protein
MNPHTYAHVIFDKVAKNYDGEKTASSTNVLGKVLICFQKTETISCLSPCISINLKWIKDLNIRPETLKLVQEREGIQRKHKV